MLLTFNLNNLFTIWFGIEQIGADQHDIRLTIAHEIIHGLGFADWLMDWEIEAKEEEAPPLAKSPFMNINAKCFYRTNVFTHYLTGRSNYGEVIRFPDLMNRIVLDSKDKNSNEYFKGIGASEDALKAGRLLHRLSKSTSFEVKSGKHSILTCHIFQIKMSIHAIS